MRKPLRGSGSAGLALPHGAHGPRRRRNSKLTPPQAAGLLLIVGLCAAYLYFVSQLGDEELSEVRCKRSRSIAWPPRLRVLWQIFQASQAQLQAQVASVNQMFNMRTLVSE